MGIGLSYQLNSIMSYPLLYKCRRDEKPNLAEADDLEKIEDPRFAACLAVRTRKRECNARRRSHSNGTIWDGVWAKPFITIPILT